MGDSGRAGGDWRLSGDSPIAARVGALRVGHLLWRRSPVAMMQVAMAIVQFTPQLRRFTETPQVVTRARTLRGALEDAFAVNPRLRGYVLDDQGALRANVVAFVDGERCGDRTRLDQPLKPDSTVHVLQALSGG